MNMFYYLLLLVATYYLSYPKVFYKSVLLSSKNVALRKLTSLIIPKNVFSVCSIMLSFHETCEINKKKIKSTQKQQTFCKIRCKLIKTLCNIKLELTLQSLTTLKIGELVLTANSPNLSDLTIWRVTVNG